MAKTIKRVGIIFFVLVVSLLVAVGSVFAVNVTSNGDMLLADTNTANGSNGSDIDSIQNDTQNYDNTNLQTSEIEYFLSGTTSNMANIWNNAMQESIYSSKVVRVTLLNDWIANSHSSYTTSFGEGIGFNNGAIFIDNGAKVILDLNGHTINRGLSLNASKTRGSVIYLLGSLDVLDSKYNSSLVQDIYNDYYSDYEELATELLKVQCGRITGGSDNVEGGAIRVINSGILNFCGGIVYKNYAYRGAGISSTEEGNQVNVYDGLFLENKAGPDGGALYNHGKMVVYGGLYIGNTATYGAALYAIESSPKHSFTVIHNCIMAYNNASNYGGALFFNTRSIVEINDGIFYKNHSNTNGGAIAVGDGVTLTINGGEFYENVAESSGGAIGPHETWSSSTITITGGKIHDNYAKFYGGGIGIVKTIPSFMIGNNLQVYNNVKGDNREYESDIYLLAGQKLNIIRSLCSGSSVAFLGVDLASNYGAVPFTLGYKSFCGQTVSPDKFFFANNSNYPIVKEGDELMAGTSGEKPTATCEWIISQEGATPIKTTETNLNVVYNGKPYTLTNSIGDCYYIAANASAANYSFTNYGWYAFYTKASVKNAVLFLSILPKEVELEWNNTDLTYNGELQIPEATVKASDLCGSDTCNVTTITGNQSKVGKYIATASKLSNSNYKISNKKYAEYVINKANLNIDITTKSVSKEYNEKNIDIGSDWYGISTNGLLGQDNGKSLDSLFNINYASFVPQFTKDGVTNNNAVNVGEYDITVKPFEVNKVFTGNGNYNVTINYVNGGKLTITESIVIRVDEKSGYDYLLLENNKRVSYKDKGMIHRVDDSNVNIANGNAQYVLGNIMPETSVQTLLNGLVYNQETGAVVVYDKQDNRVTDNNAVVGTGWYIEYAGETIYLSVLGDVNGDGRIDATDITYLRRIANGEIDKATLNPAILLAAMVDNRGKITSVDAEILRAICKYETVINKYF